MGFARANNSFQDDERLSPVVAILDHVPRHLHQVSRLRGTHQPKPIE